MFALVRWVFVCLIIVGLSAVFLSQIEVNKGETISQVKKDLELSIQKDTAIIQRFINSDDDLVVLKEIDNSPLSIEVYRRDSIIYWNEAAIATQSAAEDGLVLTTVGDTSESGIIKLNFNAFNHSLSSLGVRVTRSVGEYAFQVGKHKFGLEFTNPYQFPWARVIAWWVFFVAWLFATLLMVRNIARYVTLNEKFYTSLIILILSVVLAKAVHYWPPFQDYFSGFSLVADLSNVATTNSLAQLMINLWAFGIITFLVNRFIVSIKANVKNVALLVIGTGFFTFFIFAYFSSVIEGFVLSSSINLEIEALMQFNAVSFGLMVCFSIAMMLIFQSTQILFTWVNDYEISPFYKLGYSLIGWGLCYGLMTLIGSFHLPIWIFAMFIAAYSLILDAYTERDERKITYLIWWLIMFSGFLAVVLFYFGLKKDIAERTQFLQSYYANPDDKVIASMVSLQDSLTAKNVFTKIASLEVAERLDMKDLYQFIFDSLQHARFDSFDVSIELFDKNTGATLFNNHFSDYYKLNQSYVNARKVGRSVYHNPFEDKYITRLEILRSFPSNASWYLFIIYDRKNGQMPTKAALPKYGYAVFSQGSLIEKVENHQASPEIELLSTVTQNDINNGYSYVVSTPSEQYKIVSWKKVSGLIKPISLFSFIFTLSGIFLLILSLVNTKYNILPDNLAVKFGARTSLKTKIQLAIILLILFTFLIIGAITGIYFKNLIEANQTIKHKEETISISNNIRSDIQNFADDEYARTFLSSKLKDLSFIHDKDLSLYDQNGQLISSTSSSMVSMRIPYSLWFASNHRNKQIYNAVNDQKEFFPIYLNEARPLAFVGIEHKSYNASAGNILDFLSTILNAYIFLFLIAGSIAITIANSITQPLTILAEKLKKFKLGKSNERLEWKSNDEIGTLITDYNNLTQELERSAGLLAKTERDMAWREMAKQVAHEIKNPLTPMKLSIQYLDKAAADHPEKAKELIPRISSTLIEQIDNLSQIANEFSNFASMPQATNEKIILNEIVETIHDLFRKREDMDINMIEPINDLYVFADKNHLVRILNNLLKNAIQAIPDNKRGRIEIELKRQDNEALIRISDNGTGIPDHMKDKVFTPNFTTKSSGTGLGLAISANMIESFNGRIYFETKVGKGTDFFVAIPLMRLDDYFSNDNRVSLDE